MGRILALPCAHTVLNRALSFSLFFQLSSALAFFLSVSDFSEASWDRRSWQNEELMLNVLQLCLMLSHI